MCYSYNSSATVEALFDGIRVINLSKMQPCFSAAFNTLSAIENPTELNRMIFYKKLLSCIGKVKNSKV